MKVRFSSTWKAFGIGFVVNIDGRIAVVNLGPFWVSLDWLPSDEEYPW